MRHRTYPRNERKVEGHDRENSLGNCLRGRGRGGGHLLPSAHGHRGWLHPGWPQRRSVDERLRLWHELFLGRGVRRLCGPVRLQVRHLGHVGRHRQRHYRLAARLVGLRPPYPRDDPSSAGIHHAGVLRQALRFPRPAHRGGGHHLRVPHPVHRERLQWSVASVWHGLRAALRRMRHRHGGGHLHLCGAWRVYGHGHERLHSGHCHAARHHRRHRGGHLEQRRLLRGHHLAVADPRRGFGHAGPLRQLLRARFVQPARRCHPHVAGHLGPAADGAEVLRHQDRPGHQAGCHHLHHLRLRGGRWILLPRWLRAPLRGPDRVCRQRHAHLRLHHPDDAVHLA